MFEVLQRWLHPGTTVEDLALACVFDPSLPTGIRGVKSPGNILENRNMPILPRPVAGAVGRKQEAVAIIGRGWRDGLCRRVHRELNQRIKLAQGFIVGHMLLSL